jgi:hypothetical protein
MIEVVEAADGWTWRMIGHDRAVLVYTVDRFGTDHEAFAAAKRYRAAFWSVAAEIDHRMGACV